MYCTKPHALVRTAPYSWGRLPKARCAIFERSEDLFGAARGLRENRLNTSLVSFWPYRHGLGRRSSSKCYDFKRAVSAGKQIVLTVFGVTCAGLAPLTQLVVPIPSGGAVSLISPKQLRIIPQNDHSLLHPFEQISSIRTHLANKTFRGGSPT